MCLMAEKKKHCSANETSKYEFDITGTNDFLCIDVQPYGCLDCDLKYQVLPSAAEAAKKTY